MARNYTAKTLKQLFGLSGNQCAFPECLQKNVLENKIVIGEICHIEGLESTSQRHNSKLSEKESNDYPNLILFCPTHHTIVDKDEKTYTVEFLKNLKKEHESKFRDNPYAISDDTVNSLKKFFEQSIMTFGDVSNQIIAQGDTINIITTPVQAANLIQSLFEENFFKLKQIAKNTARESVDKFAKVFLDTIKTKLTQDDLKKFSHPDIQHILTQSAITAGRKDSKSLREYLSNLITLRIQNDDNEFLSILYDESIQTIGKLTVNQLKIITICLLLRNVTQNNLTSLEGFEEYIKKFVYPFLDFNDTVADFQHIEYTSCGSVMGVGSWNFMNQIKNAYPQFCHYVISSEDVASLNLPNQVQSDLFELNQESSLEFKFKERKLLDEYLVGQSLENKDKIQGKFVDSQREGDENWTEFISKSESIQKALDAVGKTGIKSLSLTSVGFVIGIMYYEKITGDTIPLESWIS